MKIKNLFTVLVLIISVSCSSKIELFNGIDLTGWTPVADSSSVFSVENGCILVSGNPMGYIRTDSVFGDYVLHVEWRWIGKGTNSGIFQRVQEEDKVWPCAIECQLKAGNAGDFVSLGGAKIEEVDAGPEVEFPLKKRNSRSETIENPEGEWNSADITCVGCKISAVINGYAVNECTGKNDKGYIALQSEGGPVMFRNVYLTKID